MVASRCQDLRLQLRLSQGLEPGKSRFIGGIGARHGQFASQLGSRRCSPVDILPAAGKHTAGVRPSPSKGPSIPPGRHLSKGPPRTTVLPEGDQQLIEGPCRGRQDLAVLDAPPTIARGRPTMLLRRLPRPGAGRSGGARRDPGVGKVEPSPALSRPAPCRDIACAVLAIDRNPSVGRFHPGDKTRMERR